MSADVKNAIVQELLDERLLHRERSALRHGVPTPQRRNVVGGTSAEPAETPAAPATPTEPSVVQKAGKWWDRIKFAAKVASVAIPAAGAGAVVMDWLDGDDAPPAVAPDTGPAAGDLLEYLDREGYAKP